MSGGLQSSIASSVAKMDTILSIVMKNCVSSAMRSAIKQVNAVQTISLNVVNALRLVIKIIVASRSGNHQLTLHKPNN